ncbi:MAG TPA: hypothetical protein VGO22_23220 [Pseudorhizobium sp.]|jgi:hypothetical protein|nr:hypothetical protein [Pseudorhizobium sp.]
MWSTVAAQSQDDLRQFSLRISGELRNAETLVEVVGLAVHWNGRYATTAKALDPAYAADLDIFLDAVEQKIVDTLAEPAVDAVFKSLAPKMHALLTSIPVPGWVSPMIAFLSALQPSNVASDVVEVHKLDELMQERIRTGLDRASGEPLWFGTLQPEVLPLPHPSGSTIRLP